MEDAMSEHTPGPLEFYSDEYGCREIFPTALIHSSSREICSTCGLFNDAEDRANARLIAAAPEMLDALKFIYDHIADKERGPRDLYPAFGLDAQKAVGMTRAAIAKATGDSNA